jgi:hypothetical protein
MPTFPDSVERIERVFKSHLSTTDKLVAIYVAWRKFENPFNVENLARANVDLGLNDCEIENALARIAHALDREGAR